MNLNKNFLYIATYHNLRMNNKFEQIFSLYCNLPIKKNLMLREQINLINKLWGAFELVCFYVLILCFLFLAQQLIRVYKCEFVGNWNDMFIYICMKIVQMKNNYLFFNFKLHVFFFQLFCFFCHGTNVIPILQACCVGTKGFQPFHE